MVTYQGISIPDTYILDHSEDLSKAIEESLHRELTDTIEVVLQSIKGALESIPEEDKKDVFNNSRAYKAIAINSIEDLKQSVLKQLETVARIKHLQAIRG